MPYPHLSLEVGNARIGSVVLEQVGHSVVLACKLLEALEHPACHLEVDALGLFAGKTVERGTGDGATRFDKALIEGVHAHLLVGEDVV